MVDYVFVAGFGGAFCLLLGLTMMLVYTASTPGPEGNWRRCLTLILLGLTLWVSIPALITASRFLREEAQIRATIGDIQRNAVEAQPPEIPL